MNGPNSLAAAMARLTLLRDEADRAIATLKGEYLRVQGAGGRTIAFIEGQEAATVTSSRPAKARAVVEDRAAFTAWVEANVPHAIESQVRKIDERSILADVLNTGDLPDGVTIEDGGTSTVTVRMSDQQRSVTAAAIRTVILDTLLPATEEVEQ